MNGLDIKQEKRRKEREREKKKKKKKEIEKSLFSRLFKIQTRLNTV
jgi:hypothetical protein